MSPGRTGTRAWPRIGPSSSTAVTSCTVQPASASPAASARAWVCRPGYFGRSEGWMFSIRPREPVDEAGRQHAHEPGKAEDIGPRRKDRLQQCRLERRAVACRRRGDPPPPPARPSAAALRQPARIGIVRGDQHRTRRMVARAMSRTSASMFEPPPEIRMATRLHSRRPRVAHPLPRRDLAQRAPRVSPSSVSSAASASARSAATTSDHADAAVEGLEQFRLGHARRFGQPAEHRRQGPGAKVDLRSPALRAARAAGSRSARRR